MKIEIVFIDEKRIQKQMMVFGSWACVDAHHNERPFCPISSEDNFFEQDVLCDYTSEEDYFDFKMGHYGISYNVCPVCRENSINCDGYTIKNTRYTEIGFNVVCDFECQNKECNQVMDYYGMSFDFIHMNLVQEPVYKNRRSTLARLLNCRPAELYYFETLMNPNVFEIMLVSWLSRESRGCQ